MSLPPLKHRVRQGDTLVRLAEQYQVPLETLVAINRIQDARLLWTGQELIVPRAARPAPIQPESIPPLPVRNQVRRSTATPTPRAGAARRRVISSQWLVAEGEALQSNLALDELHALVTSMEPDELVWWFQFIFGQDIPTTAIQRLRSAVLDDKLPAPRLIVVKSKLDGHAAAYHGPSRSILLSQELVNRARSDNSEAWKLFCCLVEEFGHHLDQLLRTHYSSVGGDAPLDEGTRVAYSLIDLGCSKGQQRREIARHTTLKETIILEVEYVELTAAVQQALGDAAQRDDGRKGPLEYFGSGRGSGHTNSFGHESIEDALKDAGFGQKDRNAIYFGNWLRDVSQIIDPKFVRPKNASWYDKRLSRDAVTGILDVMAREKFGNEPHFAVSRKILGVYRNEEHIDNPRGMEDGRKVDAQFRGPCTEKELEINSLRMKNFIRTGSVSAGRPPSIHRVKDGETLDGLARANGLTWQELARYNFGTSDTTEVNRQLRAKIGCRQKTHDGLNFIFTSQDAPGLIRIPGTQANLTEEASYSAFRYMSGQLHEAVKAGRTNDGFRHFGQALHILEDFFSHTNFVELTIIDLGVWVEPWAHGAGAKAGHALAVPLVSGQFGGLDTGASILLGILESIAKDKPYSPGEAKRGVEILMILLGDYGYEDARKMVGAAGQRLSDLEKNMPGVYHFLRQQIHTLTYAIATGLIAVLKPVANLIDDAQTAFLSDPKSTDPTHTQLAKDHDDHPLHALAANLAAGAVLDVGKTMQLAWSGKATADDVVRAASHYIAHPSTIDPHGPAGWTRDHVRAWMPGHKATLAQLGSKSWAVDWTKRASHHLHEWEERARKLLERFAN